MAAESTAMAGSSIRSSWFNHLHDTEIRRAGSFLVFLNAGHSPSSTASLLISATLLDASGQSFAILWSCSCAVKPLTTTCRSRAFPCCAVL
ncbi:hypothetical protein EJB05_02151, partial [Eragrostis curvula]